MSETLLGLVTDLVRHSWTSLDANHYLEGYLESQWLSPSALAVLQQAKLRRLVWHCYLNVPRLRVRMENALPPWAIEALQGLDTVQANASTEATGEVDPVPDASLVDQSEGELEERRRAVLLRADMWAGAPPGKILELPGGARGVSVRGRLVSVLGPINHRHEKAPWFGWIASGGGLVAATCERGQLHALADHALVEVLDDGGRTQAEGHVGRIVATDLHDYVRPRLRRDTRYRGQLLSGSCRCGRAFPRLAVEPLRTDCHEVGFTMNILYHHRTRGEDVEAVHIRGIVEAMRAQGHRVDMVSPPGVDPLRARRPSEAVAATSGASTPSLWSVLSRKAPEHVFEAAELGYNAYALAALEMQLSRARYQMIYDRYALFSIAGVLTAGRRGIPLILEVNDSAVVSRIRPLKLRAAARRMERFVWRRADAIVTITNYFRDLILDAGVSPDRVHVIPNAVDAATFTTVRNGAAIRARHGLDGKITVGYVGAINFWRRVDLLVHAFARLSAKHPRAHLVLTGEGPDREGVADLARSLGLENRVTFTGKVPHGEIPDHLAALDIAVIPHSNTYGSPMKLFEYMAAGCTVLAPWLPPIVSIIGQDDGGVLFPPLDEHGLTRALDDVLADQPKRIALGARAREKALSRYVWKQHAETILDIHGALPS
jgi:glycosyltransferase involved in cell wall biosynthesis